MRLGDPPAGEARFVIDTEPTTDPLAQRAMALLARRDEPMSTSALREALAIRKQALLDALRVLLREGRVRRVGREGWAPVALPDAVP